jgi:hypothetical protein
MIDEGGGVYWIFVLARSSDGSRGLDALATCTDVAIVVDGVCSFRRIVASSCCFCSSGVMVDHRGTCQIYRVDRRRVKRGATAQETADGAGLGERGEASAAARSLRLPRRLAGQLRLCTLTSCLATQKSDAMIAPNPRLRPAAAKVVRAGVSAAP